MRTARAAAARAAAYQRGKDEFENLCEEPTFRDFVVMFIGEGYKRNRNVVAASNSDPAVVRLIAHWIRRFSTNPVTCSFQYHADQDPDRLTEFWAREVGLPESAVTAVRKSNSGQLSGRMWRCRYGVLSVRANDTAFQARLQAWVDGLKDSWPDAGRVGTDGA